MAQPGDIDILAVHYVQRTYDDFYVPHSRHLYLFLCRNQHNSKNERKHKHILTIIIHSLRICLFVGTDLDNKY